MEKDGETQMEKGNNIMVSDCSRRVIFPRFEMNRFFNLQPVNNYILLKF